VTAGRKREAANGKKLQMQQPVTAVVALATEAIDYRKI
jgi:hypothetical protein